MCFPVSLLNESTLSPTNNSRKKIFEWLGAASVFEEFSTAGYFC